MSRWHAYLNSGKKIIGRYDGRVPLAAWLKDFFKEHKQMGSQDRKQVAELVYGFYRLGHAARHFSAEDRMLTAFFLCNAAPHPLLQYLKPEWNDAIQLPIEAKVVLVQQAFGEFRPGDIFPWNEALSEGLDGGSFAASFLQQPDLFLRIRPGKETGVIQKLMAAGISFRRPSAYCLVLANGTKADSILTIDEEVVVQDYSSQRTGGFFPLSPAGARHTAVWDCCAASGGKSIMAYDLNPGIQLTVSDTRPAILYNLHERFKKAGIPRYKSFVADLAKHGSGEEYPKPDIIIADLPCSGSGTWARTPEQLYFFDPVKIDDYSTLQKKIIGNVIPRLQSGGQLVYITCSVFRKENEEVVKFIQEQFPLRLTAMELLQGYTMKADTLFAARFERV